MRINEVTPRVVHEILLNIVGGIGYDPVVSAALRARFDIADGIEFTSVDVGTDECIGMIVMDMKFSSLADEIIEFLSGVTDEEYGARWTRLTVTVRHFRERDFA
jgi:hypothetical protein